MALTEGNMGKIAKRGLGIAALIFLLASCAAMPKRPENLTRDDYNFTKEYITWLIKQETSTGLCRIICRNFLSKAVSRTPAR